MRILSLLSSNIFGDFPHIQNLLICFSEHPIRLKFIYVQKNTFESNTIEYISQMNSSFHLTK